MKKKILILSASPRRRGNSAALCTRFAEGSASAGHDVETIILADKNINYCLACGSCYQRGHSCPQKDDASEILQKMIDADVIVMATPVYFYTMCAQMKTLIDRTVARYTEIKGKEFYFLMSAADGTDCAMDRVIEEFRGFTACLDDPKERGILRATGVWNLGDIEGRPILDEAYEMGATIK